MEREGGGNCLPSNIRCQCGIPRPNPSERASLVSTPQAGEGAHFRCCCRLIQTYLALEKACPIILIFIFVFHVKRFRVKRFVKVNKTNSLTYTKFAEDHVQDILDVDPAEQPAERPSRHPQLLRRQFLTFLNRRHTALHRHGRRLQKFALPLPTDQAALPRATLIWRQC